MTVLKFGYEPVRLTDDRIEAVSPSNLAILENRSLCLRFVYAVIQIVFFIGL